MYSDTQKKKMEQLQNQITDLLTVSDTPVKTLNIAKTIFGENGTSKNVNPTLYRLEKEGIITKVSRSDGTDPKWWLKSKGEPTVETEPEDNIRSYIRNPEKTIEDTVLEILSLDKNTYVPTLQIAKGVYGKTGTTKQINPMLYLMMKQGKISKISDPDGTKPRWLLNKV